MLVYYCVKTGKENIMLKHNVSERHMSPRVLAWRERKYRQLQSRTRKLITGLRAKYKTLTIARIADITGVTPNTVYRWSRGDAEMNKCQAQILIYHAEGKIPPRIDLR